jgi:uncharacterized damage-inducible protein DinB
LIHTLNELFLKELQRLEEEINSFPDEISLWKTAGEVNNSAGNLCLHLCGNLQHYVGAVLGNTGYFRNRDAEFSNKNYTSTTLVKEIHRTREAVSQSFILLKESDLKKNYPQNVLDHDVITEYFLIHLLVHFGYHLGQMNYLRRILS